MGKHKCIFCKIINGKAAGSIVYKDELVMAFLDVFELNPGHIKMIGMRHGGTGGESLRKSR